MDDINDEVAHNGEPPKSDPPPPPPPPHEDNSLRDAVARLEEIVTGLSAQVAALAPTPGDEKPTSKPWTHRGAL